MFPKIVLSQGQSLDTKVTIGKYRYPVTLTKKGSRLWWTYDFNKLMGPEIKTLQGWRYHGFDDINPVKQWSIADTPRNHFRLAYMAGQNPYANYDKPLLAFDPRREIYGHQCDITRHMITRQYCIVSAEMGTGKTLSAIEAMEWLALQNSTKSWFYVAPRSALVSVQLEFEKWRSLVNPQFHTYDALVRLMENWPADMPPPQGVIFDESSRVKTPTSQRSTAAMHLANAIRERWAAQGAVILMSGSPAPKSPLDWYNQCEIACPGFIKESTFESFKYRLSISTKSSNDAGQTYAKHVTWLDDENKCQVCGLLKSDPEHDEVNMIEPDYHAFQASVNEVAGLYKRMSGLVIVKFKKDCLDLPDKNYRIIRCKPTPSVINAAKLITARSESVVKTMMLMRELSSGFQYQAFENGNETCWACEGSRTREEWVYCGPEDKYDEVVEAQNAGKDVPPEMFRKEHRACFTCDGTGQVIKYQRSAEQVPCPKFDVLSDIIDEYDDIGRLVTYGSFTGSIDRIVETYINAKWEVIRVDGRGWWSTTPDKPQQLIKRFQSNKGDFPRLAFVGHPGSAGMGLTLTASPAIVYIDNDNNGENRLQSEDRIHRPGMDYNLGATIIDIFHLPIDEVIYESNKRKKRLQDMTLGDFRTALEKAEEIIR